MSLAPGSRLGPYEIHARLGAGGMGEVYRAEDSRLGRQVAIKVLPESVAAEPERLARFEREAKVLASLSHPHIATLFSFETAEVTAVAGATPVPFLVMELAPGETLAELLARGAIPVNEALAIARQIAEALEEAHEKGIVHRDLKPANIKVSADGQVKVLDFGLAKAVEPAPPADSSASQLAHSPTLTLGASVQGVILGTAAYMAPEQARGAGVDKRADIWAFGVVVYEMLAGRSLFAGDSVPDTLAGVLRAEVDHDALPAATPPAIRRLLRRCLERNPKNRLHDIADARLVLDEVLVGKLDERPQLTAATLPSRPGWKAWLPWAVAAAALAGAVFSILRSGTGTGPQVTLRADLAPPRDHGFYFQGDYGAPAILSPDGETVIYGVMPESERTARLWARSLVTGEQRELPGTEGASAPFFSADGAAIGFFAESKLKTVALAGGRPLTLAEAQNGRGGAWTADGTIVFSPDFRSPLFRVRAAGGTPAPLTTIDETRHSSHRWPVLAGDRVIYLAVHHSPEVAKDIGLRIVGLDGSDDRPLLSGLANAAFAGGHLLFLRETTLFAQPFDLRAGTLEGEPAALVQSVLVDNSTWRATFAASERRLLVATGSEGGLTHLSWLDRDGRAQEEVSGDGYHWDLRLSPDGRTLAVSRGQEQNDLWLIDLERGTESRFTFETSFEDSPVWSPDGRWVYYLSRGHADLRDRVYRKPANGAGASELVYESTPEEDLYLNDVTADGRALVLTVGTLPFERASDLAFLTLGASPQVHRLAETPFVEGEGRLSPDGRFLAFGSLESGNFQVFVVALAVGDPWQPPTAKWQVSTEGGRHPLWSRDGTELVFLDLNGNLSRVAVARDTADTLRFGVPTAVASTTAMMDTTSLDIAADGRLLINHFGEDQSEPLRLIEPWTALLPR